MPDDYSDHWGGFQTREGSPTLAWLLAPASQWSSFEVRKMRESPHDDAYPTECIEGVTPDAWSVYACDDERSVTYWVSDYRNAFWAQDAVTRLTQQLSVVRKLSGLSTERLEPLLF